jgi:hypothetical protein
VQKVYICIFSRRSFPTAVQDSNHPMALACPAVALTALAAAAFLHAVAAVAAVASLPAVCQVVSATGCTSRVCCVRVATCCCWMSPPMTWTWTHSGGRVWGMQGRVACMHAVGQWRGQHERETELRESQCVPHCQCSSRTVLLHPRVVPWSLSKSGGMMSFSGGAEMLPNFQVTHAWLSVCLQLLHHHMITLPSCT